MTDNDIDKTNLDATKTVIAGVDDAGNLITARILLDRRPNSDVNLKLKRAMSRMTGLAPLSPSEYICWIHGCASDRFFFITLHRHLDYVCRAVPCTLPDENGIVTWTPNEVGQPLERTFVWTPPVGVQLVSVLSMTRSTSTKKFVVADYSMFALSKLTVGVWRKPPLPNLHADCRACTGPMQSIPEHDQFNLFDHATTLRDAWLANPWNMDLAPSQELMATWLRFNSNTGHNVVPPSADNPWDQQWHSPNFAGDNSMDEVLLAVSRELVTLDGGAAR